MKNIIICIMVLTITGCAATGTQIKGSQLSQFEEGRTTMNEVTSALGSANTSTRNSDGTRTLVYVYAEFSTRPETFIPYIGMFVGGSDMKTNSVMLTFSPGGVLQSYSTSESSYGTGMGAASGMPADNRTNQPTR